jgi:hypothetical protein
MNENNTWDEISEAVSKNQKNPSSIKKKEVKEEKNNGSDKI